MAVLVGACCVVSASAEPLPLFELGLGLGGHYQPYYPGSSQSRAYAFPVPLPVYRGDMLKSDEDGVRAEVIDEPRYSLDISMDFNLAVDSDKVDLRYGMDDIGSLLEIGPSLEVLLSEGRSSQWLLALPLRGQLQSRSDQIVSAGYTFSPALYRYQDLQIAGTLWRLNVSASISFSTQKAHEVFYQVDEVDETVWRPRYNVGSGYSGFSLQTVLRSRNDKRLIVYFVRFDWLDGAEFIDSPLVDTRYGASAGVIYSRFIFRSKTQVGSR